MYIAKRGIPAIFALRRGLPRGPRAPTATTPTRYAAWSAAGAASDAAFGYFGRLWTWISSPRRMADCRCRPVHGALRQAARPTRFSWSGRDRPCDAVRGRGDRATASCPPPRLLTVEGWGHTSAVPVAVRGRDREHVPADEQRSAELDLHAGLHALRAVERRLGARGLRVAGAGRVRDHIEPFLASGLPVVPAEAHVYYTSIPHSATHASRSRVEPSTSVKRKVTVPAGRASRMPEAFTPRAPRQSSPLRAVLAAVDAPGVQVAEQDHRDEDEPDYEHRERRCRGPPRPRSSRADRASRRLYPTRRACAASARVDRPRRPHQTARPRRPEALGVPRARATRSAPTRASRRRARHAVAAHAGPSPSRPSARACEHSEISSARSETAADVAGLRDVHEPMRIEVVAEEQRHVLVGRREEPRAPVVHEVALVDRLEPERVLGRRQRRENGLAVLLLLAPRASAQSGLSAAARS